MKKLLQFLFLLLAGLAAGGCATPYMVDRKRDAADIFTASYGAGVGAKLRAGPVGTGLLLDATQGGLRGGQWLCATNFVNRGQPFPWSHEIQFLLFGEEQFLPGQEGQQRRKAFCATMAALVNVPVHESFAESSRAMALALREQPPARIHNAAFPYLTQVEAVLGIGYTVRLGFSAGELLDFMLGWAHVDLCRDDIASLPPPPPAPREHRAPSVPEVRSVDSTRPAAGAPKTSPLPKVERMPANKPK